MEPVLDSMEINSYRHKHYLAYVNLYYKNIAINGQVEFRIDPINMFCIFMMKYELSD